MTKNGTTGTERPEQNGRDPIVTAVLAVVLVCAVVASSSTLAEMARASAWKHWTPWMLPACIDALGIAAGKVWLSSSAPEAARVYARRVTFSVVILSMAGQSWWHVLSASGQRPGVVLVILVGSVPPAAVAVVVHLGTLVYAPVPGRRSRGRSVPVVPVVPVRGTDAKAVPGTAPVPVPRAVPAGRGTNGSRSGSRPVKEPDEVLIRRVRHINTEHRERNGGKDITRDALRVELGCSATKASELLQIIKQDEVA